MSVPLSGLSIRDLMLLNREISDELIERDVCRTRNSPTGDIAEHLFQQTYDWKLEPNSRAGFDATSEKYGKVQIKSRFLSDSNMSRQAGDIRGLNEDRFDWLAAVVFAPDATVDLGLMIPHGAVQTRALDISYTNSSRIYLRRAWLEVDGVIEITEELANCWNKIAYP